MPVLVAEKLPSVVIDAKTVSASSKSVMLVPLAEKSPSETVPGLLTVTESVVDTSETGPRILKTSDMLSDNWIKPTAFKFADPPTMILAPTSSLILPFEVSSK